MYYVDFNKFFMHFFTVFTSLLDVIQPFTDSVDMIDKQNHQKYQLVIEIFEENIFSCFVLKCYSVSSINKIYQNRKKKIILKLNYRQI